MVATEQHVVLRGGLSVSISALQILWDLEDRGLNLRLDPDDGALLVSPRTQITPDDDAKIRQHRDELKWLVRYVAEVIQ